MSVIKESFFEASFKTIEKFDNAANDNMSDMNNYSKILYQNFKKIL